MLKNLVSRPFISPFKNAFNRYSDALIQKPYKTKMITAGTLTVIGDAVCQTVIEKKKFTTNYDFRRTLNLALIGSLISAPFCHLWYMNFAPAICRTVSNNTKLYPYISMVFDQTLIATSTLGVFLFLSEYLKNFNLNDAKANLNRKFRGAIMTNWKIWPPLILINFLIVPPHFRVFFTNFLGFFWGIYLSWYQYNC